MSRDGLEPSTIGLEVTPGRGRADHQDNGGAISRHRAQVDKVDRVRASQEHQHAGTVKRGDQTPDPGGEDLPQC
jgi:hypothetical protein